MGMIIILTRHQYKTTNEVIYTLLFILSVQNAVGTYGFALCAGIRTQGHSLV